MSRAEFDRLADLLEQGPLAAHRRQATRQALTVVRRRIDAEMPERSGQLKRDVRESVTGDGTDGELEFYAPHALFVHEPTRPHLIRPKSTKALKFNLGGRAVFAKVVRHPGTKGIPFIPRGLDAAEGDIGEVLDELGDAFFGEVA